MELLKSGALKVKYLAYNKIAEKNYNITVEHTMPWINVIWTDFSFSSYLNWEYFEKEWKIIRKL